MRARITSSMAWWTTSPSRSAARPGCSSSPARPPSPSRIAPPIRARSPRSSAFAMCCEEACAETAIACASSSSSPMRATGAHIWAAPVRGRGRQRLCHERPPDDAGSRHDRAGAALRRDRARPAQADREPDRLRPLSCRPCRSSEKAWPTTVKPCGCSIRAIALDPSYGAALGFAARCYQFQKLMGWVPPSDPGLGGGSAPCTSGG